MSMDKFHVEIASVPDREELVGEIWVGEAQFAELRQEKGQIRVQLYAKADGGPWDLTYSELVRMLAETRSRLTE